MTRARVLGWGGGAAILTVVLVLGLSGTNPSARTAPALPRDVLVGPPTTLGTLRGRPALITFWASWCVPCAQEAPTLERFAQRLPGGARLVGVNLSDELSGARSFLRRYHWSFPNLRDSEGAVASNYGVTGPPATFVLDANGRIRQTLSGPQTEQTLSRALKRL